MKAGEPRKIAKPSEEKDPTWTGARGERIKVSRMRNTHLWNTVRFLRRRSEELRNADEWTRILEKEVRKRVKKGKLNLSTILTEVDLKNEMYRLERRNGDYFPDREPDWMSPEWWSPRVDREDEDWDW